MSSQPTLGILTLYLNDRKVLEELPIYEKMTTAGRRRGLNVIVFTPDDVQERNGRIHAMQFHPDKRTWSRRWVTFPQVIYDRCRYQRTDRFQRLLAFRRKYTDLVYLNRPLRNKWTIYRTLAKNARFSPHLPSTRLYESPNDVTVMLQRYATVYFKPINGTGGRGILRIDRQRGGTLLLQGRNHRRQIISPKRVRRETLAELLRAWDFGGDRYIVQQGLQIKLPNGRIHDYRMLVQKNGNGNWEVTGCAGRIGPRNSITSNLHGGGKAATMEALLQQWMGDKNKSLSIRQTAEALGIDASLYLENQYGALCELALDLAIDRGGRVWLLEVNPKPSREVFIRAGEQQVYDKAITRPIEYALWVYRKQNENQSGRSALPTVHAVEEETKPAAADQ